MRFGIMALALGLLLAACGSPSVEVDPQTSPTPTASPTPSPTPEPTPEPSPDEPTESPTPDPTGATPDDAALADPCADHQDRVAEAFIEVVSPVGEQRVGDEVELVGCSNVFEATVLWRLYDGDGRLLDEGFTTAECGSGCVGAFRETLSLEAADGEPFAELHVFWESPEDGSERDLVAIPLVLG